MADSNATEMAAAMVDGDCNGNDQWQWQRRWAIATATAMAMAMATELVGNGDRDGNGDGNGNGHGKGNHYKGRVASSCGRDVQRFWTGNTLPPPPWTQSKMHSPVLHHGGNTAKSVCSPSRGRVPDSSPWIVFFTFYNYCSVY